MRIGSSTRQSNPPPLPSNSREAPSIITETTTKRRKWKSDLQQRTAATKKPIAQKASFAYCQTEYGG
jgi:hypothetical protein